MELFLTEVLAGGVIVVLLAATSLIRAARNWWRTVAVIAVAASVFNLIVSLSERRQPARNLLIRDVVAWVILSGFIPPLVAGVSRGLAGMSPWIRIGAAVLTLVVLGAAAPFILLVVHCTSGDCL